jgi:hypothetical protein
LFDDFSGSSIDTGKWNYSGSPSVLNSEVSLNENESIMASTIAFGEGYEIRSRSKANEQDICFVGLSSGSDSRIDMVNSDAINGEGDYNATALVSFKSGSGIPGGGQEYDGWNDFRNTYYQYWIYRNTNHTLTIGQGSNSATYSTSTYIYTGNLYPRIYVWNSSQESTLICDWIFVRKHISSEPSASSWGLEENI